jgi:Spy/CpxP family protein refolding chaperone
MKHFFLSASLAALALTSTLALAQSTPASPDTTPQKGYHRHNHTPDPHLAAQRMGERLGLSADQTAKLEPIFADSQKKIAALRSDTTLSQDQRRQQFHTIHQNMKTELAGVLTPEQMQQLSQMRHHRGRGQRQQSAPPSPQPGN